MERVTSKPRVSKNASSPTPSRPLLSSKSSKKEVFYCPICGDIIIDDGVSKEGQDSVFCEGICSTWLHRGCAGLSKKAFSLLKTSDQPFHCVSCRLNIYSADISKLHSVVNNLSKELSDIKSQVASLSTPVLRTDSAIPGNPETPVVNPSPPSSSAVNSSPPSSSVVPNSENHVNSYQQRDYDTRKFNVVVYGVHECKEGLHYNQRLMSDMNNISSLLSTNPKLNVPTSSIKDCHRLGKYVSTSDRPRPILVRLNSCPVVMSILANRSSFAPFTVKQDLTPQERTREKILLKERWNLCCSGVNKSSIKIKGNCLFVNGQLYGRVNRESKFVTSHEILSTNPAPSNPNPYLPHPETDTCTNESPPLQSNSASDNAADPNSI